MIFWTPGAVRTHNTSGRSPSTAPMKTNSQQVKIVQKGWRHTAILFVFLGLISTGATLGLSQEKSQKRVTALQLGDAAAGARVTIVSDSALNDYEAFRRGDRFYVKIPLADFSAATPNFRGNGFEDVRVQKVGDSVVVSFKLQPGATARVDQRSNRLDVIFSVVGAAGNVAPVNIAKSYPTSRNRRNTIDSEAAAGPVPPMSSTPVRELRRSADTEVLREVDSITYADGGRASRSTRRAGTRTGSTQDNNRGGASEGLSSPTKSTLPASMPSPATMATPYSTATSATTLGTPAATGTQNPYGVPVAANSKVAETSTWDSRVKFVKAWAKLNRSALIIGGLIALALLIGLVVWSRRRGKGTRAAKTPRKDLKKSKVEKVAGRTVVESPAYATPVAKPPISSPPTARPDVWTQRSAAAGFATAGIHQSREAEQDREVFEI